MSCLLLQITVVSAATGSLRATALYAVVILAALLSVLWRAQVGLYLLTVLLPLQTTRYHLHVFPLGANIVDILLFCSLLGSVLRPPPPLAFKSRIPGYLLAMAAFYYLSVWRGAFYLGGGLPLWFSDSRLVDYKNFMVMPLLAFAAMRILRTRKQIAIILALCCCTSLAVDYSYLKSTAGRSFTHYSEEARDAGPLGYAGENGLASYEVEITAALLALLALRQSPLRRAALLLLVAANICCVLFSYSREAYLALAAVLLLVALVRMRLLLVPLLLLAFCWQAVLPTAVQERMTMTYTHADGQAELDRSAEERIMLWTDAMSLFHHHPVFGTGFLTYGRMDRVGPYRDTHNFYLKLLVETGLVGLLLFLVQLALFFGEGYALFRRARDPFLSAFGLGYAALILAAAIVNIFGDRWLYIQVDSNLWILLGCVLCASAISATQPAAAAVEPQPPALHPWNELPCPAPAASGSRLASPL